MTRKHPQKPTWKQRIAALALSTMISSTLYMLLFLVSVLIAVGFVNLDDWLTLIEFYAGWLLIQAIALVLLALYRKGPDLTSGALRVYAMYVVMLGVVVANALDGDHLGDLFALTGILLILAIPVSLLGAAIYNWQERRIARSATILRGGAIGDSDSFD